MRIALFDAIQEEHVGASLERALRAAGHEVYSTGRFGKGFAFRDPQTVLTVAGEHLDRIADFRPDWILVFRPGSAPQPILERLRATGAALAVWLSDDPVLFDLSYGPIIDLYDLVLHCGNAAVLQFYEDRFGRPTGVNLPFWTDHEAFPVVYGHHEPESTAVFLGNVDGPVRRPRYHHLAQMRTEVRIFGQTGEDPYSLGRGFLDTDLEIRQALSRSRVALNIPQVFTDHRGLQTWFPGLDDLGYFELPSRVIQYGALGIPTVSIIPGPSGPTDSRAYPEVVVCGSFQEADDWIEMACVDGALEELSCRTVETFDRWFSADARVMALESLTTDDSWRDLSAADRAVWFQQFDGRQRPEAAPQHAEPDPAAIIVDTSTQPHTEPSRSVQPQAVVVLYATSPQRFDALDVILRELDRMDTSVRAWGPDRMESLTQPGQAPLRRVVDVDALLAAVGLERPEILVLGESLGLTADGSSALRQAGIATVSLAGGAALTSEQAHRFDLLAHAGPVGWDRMADLRARPHSVHTPGLVESAFLEAARARPPRDAAVELAISADLAEADLEELAERLAHQVVHLVLDGTGSRRTLPPGTAYALAAAESVVTERIQRPGKPDVYGDWLIRADSAAEAELKLSWAAGSASGPHTRPTAEQIGEQLDARRQLLDWFTRARQRRASLVDQPGTVLGQAPQALLRIGVPITLRSAPDFDAGPGRTGVRLTLGMTPGGPVAGVRVLREDQVLQTARWPVGTVQTVDVEVDHGRAAEPRPLQLELLADPISRTGPTASVRVCVQMLPITIQSPPSETATPRVLLTPVHPTSPLPAPRRFAHS